MNAPPRKLTGTIRAPMNNSVFARGCTAAAIAITLGLSACGGPAGPAGKDGVNGKDGTNGINGTDGTNGTDGADGRDAAVDAVVLPGFFGPESIHAGADGTLYVSSVSTGALVSISPDGRTLTTVLAAENAASPNEAQVIGKLGVLVDTGRSDLWLCTMNTTTYGSTLRRYDLSTFAKKGEFPVQGGVCNDIAIDAAGNVYVTDSFTGIERLPVGGAALELWAIDSLFTAAPGSFAINGIVLDGDNLYVNNLTAGTLIRVAIKSDGTPGVPTVIDGVTLTNPDGMRLRAPGRILVAESSADTLSEISVNAATNMGTRQVLSNRVDRPSSVAVSGGAAWVAEGQIGRIFNLDPTLLNLPFRVVRVPMY